MKISSKIQLLILLLSTIISAYAHAADTPECVINKSYFEGGDTLTLTMPNELFSDGDSALRIDIVDTETGKQLISCPFVTESGDSTTVNIELPSSGIRSHEDIVKFFPALSYHDAYLYAHGDKYVFIGSDWAVPQSARGDKYMAYLRSIPFERINYISFTPRVYHPQLGKQTRDDVYKMYIGTDRSNQINNVFKLSVLKDNDTLCETYISIHKIYFYPYGTNGKILKDANKLLLIADNDGMFYWP